MKKEKFTDPEYGYITSSLPEYVENNKEIIVKDLEASAPSIVRATHMRVKNKAYLNYLGLDSHLQDGKGCGFNPANPATFTQRTIETALIKKDLKFCADDLLGFWPEYEVRVPESERDNFPFEAYILAELNNQTAEQMEKLQWQGDTDSEDVDLKWIDGWLTLLEAASDTIKVTITAGKSVYEGIRTVISNLPPALIKKGGVKVSIAPELYLQFAFEMVDKNYYHYSGNQNEFPEEFVFPGTNIKVVSTPGLEGTLKVVATLDKNLYYGSDDDNAQKDIVVKYDEINDFIAVKVRWNQGAQVAFPDWVVLGTFAADPVSPAESINSLASIAASVATIAEDTADIATAQGTLATQVSGLNADAKVFKTKEQQ